MFGAFGAHGIEPWLEGMQDGARRLHWWRTASSYHLWHALALGLAASGAEGSRLRLASRGSFVVGIVLFSGSLYAMTLTGVKALGMVTPVGGLALIAGWGLLAVSALRDR